ncbi:MAG: hypothetical protein AW07_04297 [Candidatus Accumulibacter sp. SK-11]|nr:MAG: hypothetical protein AW07_04297 [Candidatus Accumulibacter sp. SK-11]
MLDPEDAEALANWAHGGGFSLDGSVRIECTDRPGLEGMAAALLRSTGLCAGAFA